MKFYFRFKKLFLERTYATTPIFNFESTKYNQDHKLRSPQNFSNSYKNPTVTYQRRRIFSPLPLREKSLVTPFFKSTPSINYELYKNNSYSPILQPSSSTKNNSKFFKLCNMIIKIN